MTLQDPTITCPNCQTEIRLTESLAAPLVEATKRQYEDRIATAETAAKAKADELKAERVKLDAEREAIDDKVREQLKAERAAIAASEAKKAREALSDEIDARSTELKELKDLLQAKDTKLAEAQKAQAELLRKERQLEDQKRELDLTVEKRVQESLTTAREQAKKEAEESLRLKVAEKEQTISSMQKQIEDLKRRAEQGSQQLQGEVQELELETLLASRFPLDRIEPVAKGEFGGDVIQRVAGTDGQPCALILWESKRTKNWSDGWLAKLRQDQRTAKADAAIIISQALPDGVDTFDLVDGVWVAAPGLAVPVAIAVRNAALEVSMARKAGEGQQTKTDLVYQYLTGPAFRHRVEAIVEKFTDMKADLDRERKSMTRMWAKREAQITGVIDATAGMYGDLQGIAGRSLQEIEGLSMPLLGDSTSAQEGVTDAD
tara:strand:+ start:8931 stop:10229 length:1299 start_codon:yes stop_codon:yes gene_type:complete